MEEKQQWEYQKNCLLGAVGAALISWNVMHIPPPIKNTKQPAAKCSSLFCQVVSYYTYNSLMSTSDNRLFADDSKLVSSAFAVSRLVRQVTPVSTA